MERIEDKRARGYMAQRGFNVLYVLQSNFHTLEKKAIKDVEF